MVRLIPNQVDLYTLNHQCNQFREALIQAHLHSLPIPFYSDEELLSLQNLSNQLNKNPEVEVIRLSILRMSDSPALREDPTDTFTDEMSFEMSLEYSAETEVLSEDRHQKRLIETRLKLAYQEACLIILRLKRSALREILEEKTKSMRKGYSPKLNNKIQNIENNLRELAHSIRQIHINLSTLYYELAQRLDILHLAPRWKRLWLENKAWNHLKRAEKIHNLTNTGVKKLKEHSLRLKRLQAESDQDAIDLTEKPIISEASKQPIEPGLMRTQDGSATFSSFSEQIGTESDVDYSRELQAKKKINAKECRQTEKQIKAQKYLRKLKRSRRFWGLYFNTKRFLKVMRTFDPETIESMLRYASATTRDLRQIDQILNSKAVKRLLATLSQINTTFQRGTAERIRQTVKTCKHYVSKASSIESTRKTPGTRSAQRLKPPVSKRYTQKVSFLLGY